jgi:hypothetical protein
LRRDAAEVINALTEYAQRKEMTRLDEQVVKISYAGKSADLLITPKGAFLIRGNEVDHVGKNGLRKSSADELEAAMVDMHQHVAKKLEGYVFDVLKKELKEFEISFK